MNEPTGMDNECHTPYYYACGVISRQNSSNKRHIYTQNIDTHTHTHRKQKRKSGSSESKFDKQKIPSSDVCEYREENKNCRLSHMSISNDFKCPVCLIKMNFIYISYEIIL